MIAATSDAYASFSWKRGGAAFLIALVYALAGPPIGAILVFPIATIVVVQFSHNDPSETAAAMFHAVPLGLIFSYVMAGALALITGIATAVIAYRRGVVPIRMAAMVPTIVFGALLILQQLFHGSIPGATVLRGGGQVGPALTLLVSIVASLICWRLTRTLQRRLA